MVPFHPGWEQNQKIPQVQFAQTRNLLSVYLPCEYADFSHLLLTLVLFFLTTHPIHWCWNCSVVVSAIWCPNYCSACCINVLDNRDVGRGAPRRARHFEGQACSVSTIYYKQLQDAKSHIQETKKPGISKSSSAWGLTGVGFYFTGDWGWFLFLC